MRTIKSLWAIRSMRTPQTHSLEGTLFDCQVINMLNNSKQLRCKIITYSPTR